MNSKDPALEILDVCRSFGGKTVLGPLSLTLADREIASLVGHSGCGKSTLLRILAGIDAPDSGTVRIHGAEVAGHAGLVPPERRPIGMVFQDYALFPHLTVSQNIAFGLRAGRAHGTGRSVDDLAEKLGLGEMRHRYPHTLSGGEQQRVAIARALATGPRLLLLDEPFSNLDRALRDAVRRDTIDLLKSLGTAAIVVTHDPEEALSVGDKVILMRSGRIVQSGTAYEIYDHPNSIYAADFFVAYNRIPGIVRGERIETAIGSLLLRDPLTDGIQATAYIRPQDIELESSGSGPVGAVENRTLMGEIEQVAIRVEGLQSPLIVRSSRRYSGDGQASVRIGAGPVLAFGPEDNR